MLKKKGGGGALFKKKSIKFSCIGALVVCTLIALFVFLFQNVSATTTPPAYNASTVSQQWQWQDENDPTSYTFSHTVSSGSNRILLVTVGHLSGSISGVTWNGQSLTQYANVSFDTPLGILATYYLINPDSGTHDIVVELAGQMIYEGGSMSIATDYTGVDQSTPFAAGVSQEQIETELLEMTVQPGIENTRGYSACISNSGYVPAQYEDLQQSGDLMTSLFFFVADKIFPDAYDQVFEWQNGDNQAYPVTGYLLALAPAEETPSPSPSPSSARKFQGKGISR